MEVESGLVAWAPVEANIQPVPEAQVVERARPIQLLGQFCYSKLI